MSGTCTPVTPTESTTINAVTDTTAIATPKASTTPKAITAPKAITTIADLATINEDTSKDSPDAVFNVQKNVKEASDSAIPQMGLVIGLCLIFRTLLQW